MKKEIAIAVVSSLITAVVVGFIAIAVGVFKTEVKQTEASTIAKIIVDDHIELLIHKFLQDEIFVLRVKGERGEKGDQGPSGPKGETESICNKIVAIQGRSGSGWYIGEDGGRVYSKGMHNPLDYEKLAIRCQ